MNLPRALAAGSALLLAAAVAGCTPKPLAQAGVRPAGDHAAEVVLALCPGDRPYHVAVHEVAGDAGRDWSVTGPPEGENLTSLTLFTTPPGWQPSGSLDALEPGQRYNLSVSTANGLRSEVRGFTAADLGRLRDGEVWAADGNEGRAMAESEFLRRAADKCG